MILLKLGYGERHAVLNTMNDVMINTIHITSNSCYEPLSAFADKHFKVLSMSFHCLFPQNHK